MCSAAANPSRARVVLGKQPYSAASKARQHTQKSARQNANKILIDFFFFIIFPFD